MINRGNWHLTKKYLKYRQEVDNLSPKSIRLEETWLGHVLRWADDKPFKDAVKIRPTLPQYVLTARLEDSQEDLSSAYIKKIVSCGKRFLEWLSVHQAGYKTITASYLDTLKPPRMETGAIDHEAITLEEIRQIASAPIETLRERRIRAAAVFWFLSGIRVGAFVTLPIKAINLNDLSVKQYPSLGVDTKFKKHATTYLLNIPDLLTVVKEWDDYVRANLGLDCLWFSAIDTETLELNPSVTEVGIHRDQRARKDLKAWLNRVGISYKSPHKFRHGHAVFSIQHAETVTQLKSISQNLMHANLSITDGVYGILSDTTVQKEIAALGNTPGGSQEVGKIISQLEQYIAALKANN